MTYITHGTPYALLIPAAISEKSLNFLSVSSNKSPLVPQLLCLRSPKIGNTFLFIPWPVCDCCVWSLAPEIKEKKKSPNNFFKRPSLNAVCCHPFCFFLGFLLSAWHPLKRYLTDCCNHPVNVSNFLIDSLPFSLTSASTPWHLNKH